MHGKPQNLSGMSCPFRGGKAVAKVCHLCELYTSINGIDRATGQPTVHWACAINQLVITTAETVATTAQTTASVDVMRAEAAREREGQARLLGLRPAAAQLPNDNGNLRLTDNRQSDK